MPRSDRFNPGKDQIYIVQGAEWASGPAWMDIEYLAHTGIRFLDRPVASRYTDCTNPDPDKEYLNFKF